MLDVRGKLGQFRAVRRVDLIDGKEQPCPFLREQAQELATLTVRPVPGAQDRPGFVDVPLTGGSEANEDPAAAIVRREGWPRISGAQTRGPAAGR
jgi:hypothetical protein